MQIALINGSPKYKNSASEVILEDLEECLKKNPNIKVTHFSFLKPQIDQKDIKSLFSCNCWVFAFPLYVDGIPSHLLNCMIQLEKYIGAHPNVPKTIHVYGISNSGFHEGKQNIIAIEILKNWCIKSGLIWGQGLGVGAGGMLAGLKKVPLGHGPKKNLGKAFEPFVSNIVHRKSEEIIVTSANFPRLAYKIAAEFGWRKQIKANGLKRKDIFRKCN
ncbi:hypothetical protein [Anaeromicropila herbilytica]|uniref:NADPH-dependent FMN reductase-like domain-containing protein n=1 Tax=Anaeromicropila herbilytica TaxID=2785025 RepID=A0A7R7ELI9_9FIRM|nr:hypothetical protein [Anaeromicropila herbilytica]BCN31240.1 hypothetical protein bsdtb5_25350 [Anaeromicropila herbilytica]